jgi:hypothetical protein
MQSAASGLLGGADKSEQYGFTKSDGSLQQKYRRVKSLMLRHAVAALHPQGRTDLDEAVQIGLVVFR